MKVKVTQKQFAILRDPKMYQHTKFWDSIANDIQICFELDFSRTEARGHGQSDPETVGDNCIHTPN